MGYEFFGEKLYFLLPRSRVLIMTSPLFLIILNFYFGESINLYGMCRFSVSFFSINSRTGHENLSEIPKQVMTICSRTIGYCFQEK